MPKDFKQLTEEESSRIATETFAQNLTQMKINRFYMSEGVNPDDNQRKFLIGDGLSSTIYEMFSRQLAERGWNISTRDVSTRDRLIRLLTLYR